MKIKMALCLFLSICLAGLSACEEKYTESYYFSHPEALKLVLRECQQAGETPENFGARCKQAYNTAVHMTNLVKAFSSSQTEFGQRIMRAQIRAVDLRRQLEIAQKAHLPDAELKKQLASAQQNVKNLRAIVSLFIQM